MQISLKNKNQRIDKWLWYARFFKTRSLATKVVSSGKVEMNGSKVKKSHAELFPGAKLSFFQGSWLRKIEIVALIDRRKSAKEAKELYIDHSDQKKIITKTETIFISGIRPSGLGRPTKKDRRILDRLIDLN